MPRITGRLARLSSAAALALATTALAPAAASDRISMRLEVYGLMGMRVLTLRSDVELADDSYAIDINYATSGVAGLLVEQSTKASVKGRLAAGLAVPTSFRAFTRRNGVEHRSHVEYGRDGKIDGGTLPPPKHPIPPPEIRGTVDNLTAYFRLERQLASTGNCALRVPVFDGRFRYDLAFSGGKREMLEPESGQRFKGAAVACNMWRIDRAGDDEEKMEGANQGTLWYAALVPGNDILIPVRMRLRTQIGTVDAYLAELNGRGVHLRLID
jgi:hypothetical protein